jgi:hypothetical protein
VTAEKENEPELDLDPGKPGDLLGEILIRPAGGPDPDRKGRGALFPPTEEDEPAPPPGLPAVAPLAARARAFCADTLICVLLGSGSLLAAAASAGRFPRLASWPWTGLFAAVVSFFLVVPALALFGKTPGMALTDLSAEGAYGEKPTVAAAARRWMGTLATLLLAGLPLLTLLGGRRETPADLFSGRPLRLARAEPPR